MFLEEFRQFDKVFPTLLGRHFPPRTLESLAGSGYGDIDILLGGLLNGYDGLLGGGVDGLEGLAVDSFNEFTVDEPDNEYSVSAAFLDVMNKGVVSSPSLLQGKRFWIIEVALGLDWWRPSRMKRSAHPAASTQVVWRYGISKVVMCICDEEI